MWRDGKLSQAAMAVVIMVFIPLLAVMITYIAGPTSRQPFAHSPALGWVGIVIFIICVGIALWLFERRLTRHHHHRK